MCEPSDKSTREVLGTAVTEAADSQTTYPSSSSQNIVPDFLSSSTSVEWSDPLTEGGFGDGVPAFSGGARNSTMDPHSTSSDLSQSAPLPHTAISYICDPSQAPSPLPYPTAESLFSEVLQSTQDDPSGRNLFSELCGPQQLSADQVEKFLNETNQSSQYVDSALDPSIEESINSMLRDNDPMLTSTSVENFKLDIGVFDNTSEGLSLVNSEPSITGDINPDTFLKDLSEVGSSSQRESAENKMDAIPTRRSPRVAGIAPTTLREETKAQGDKADTSPQKKDVEPRGLRRSSRIQRKDDSSEGVTPSPRTRGRPAASAKSSPPVQKTPPMARRTRASAQRGQGEAPTESDTPTTGDESFPSPPRTRRQAAARGSPAKKTVITPKRAAVLLQKISPTDMKKIVSTSKETSSPPTPKESPTVSKEAEVSSPDASAPTEEPQVVSQEIPDTPQKTLEPTQETPTTPQPTHDVVHETQVTPQPVTEKTPETPSKTQIAPRSPIKTPQEEVVVIPYDTLVQENVFSSVQESETVVETSAEAKEVTKVTEENQENEESEASPNNTRKSTRIQVKEKEEAERVELDRVRMLDHDYAQPVAEKRAGKKRGGKTADNDDVTSSGNEQEAGTSELQSETKDDTESKTATPKRGGRKKGVKKTGEEKTEQEVSEEMKEGIEKEKNGEKEGRKKATPGAKKPQEKSPKRAAGSKKTDAKKGTKETPPAKKGKRKSEASESEEEELPLKRLMEEMHKEKAQEVMTKQKKKEEFKKPERKRRKSSVQIVEVEEPILFTPDNAPVVKEEEVRGQEKKDGGSKEEAADSKEGVKTKEMKSNVKTEKPSTSTKEERRKSTDDGKKPAKEKERQRKDSVKSEKSDKDHKGGESDIDSDDSGMTFSDDPNDSDWEDEDPDKEYCICRKPHGKRFMICCDRCEEWYHGDCVGVTKKEGIRMEKNSEDYICPRCKEKEAKEKSLKEKEQDQDNGKHKEVHVRHEKKVHSKHEGTDEASTSRSDKKSTGTKEEKDKTKVKPKEENSKTSKQAKKESSKKGEEGAETLKRQKSKEEEKESEKESPTSGKKKKIKIFKEKYHPRQKCIGAGCSNWAQRGSVYCSNNCILSHARESLKLINKEKQKYGLLDSPGKKDPKSSPAKPDSTSHKKVPTSPTPTSAEKGKKDPERVAVIERSTGRLLAGLSAPTEDNLSQWLETHPTYEVLRPEVKQTPTYGKEVDKGKKGQPSKPIELDPVRLNVRRALKDLLKDRQDKCDTIKKKKSPDDIMRIASSIETELHKLYNDTGTRYKSKYRSLMFNLKDARNTALFKRVLIGDIRPHKLVKMSPDELACKELAQWRDRETKHTLEMIVKKEQEDAQMEKHVTKKTHKGEIEIDDDLGELKTEKSDDKEEVYVPSVEAEGPDVLSTMLIDTTEQHRAHLFDLNCKICTGRMAPPTDEQPVKKVKVAKTVIEASSTTKPDESSTAESPAPTVDTTTGSPSEPPLQSDTESSSPDSAMPSQSELPTSKEPSVWKGFIKMEQLTKFVTHAYPVSGSMEDIQEDLPDTIMISGRISHDHIWEYLDKIKSTGNKEISIIRFQPAVDEEKVGYVMLYSYFHSRQRFGVVGNNSRQVKDMYLIPLPSHEEVPYQLKPFDGPGLDEPRPHMLLGLIIRNRSAKRSASSSTESTPLHMPSPGKHRRYSEISGTPPSTSPSVSSGSKHRHHRHHHHHYKQEHERKQPPEQKKEESKRKSEAATPVPAKKVYTIPEHEISDPIVKQYANVDPSALIARTSQDEMEEMPYSPGQAAQEEEEEQPYDPGDEDFLPVEAGVESPPPQSPPLQQDSDSDSVLEVAVGQSDSNEASASQSEPSLDNILMTPLGDNPTLSEQQRLLIELTKQVEEQKKLLLEQQKNLESICSGPNSATGSPVVEFPTAKGDVKTVSTVGENILVTVSQVQSTVASTNVVSSATASSTKTASTETKTETTTAGTVSTSTDLSAKVEGSDSPLPMIPGLGGDLTPPVDIPGLGGSDVVTAATTTDSTSSNVQEKVEEKATISQSQEKVSEAVSVTAPSTSSGAAFEIPANISELLQKVSSIVKQTSQVPPTTVSAQQPLVQQAQIPQGGVPGYLPPQTAGGTFQQGQGLTTQAAGGQQIPGAQQPMGSFGGTWTTNQSAAQPGPTPVASSIGERRSDDSSRSSDHASHGDSRPGPHPGYDPRNVQRFEYNEHGRQTRRDSGDDRHSRDRWHDRRDDRSHSRRDRDEHRDDRRGSRDHSSREGRDRERDRDRDRDRERWRQDRNARDRDRGSQWQQSHRRR